MKAAIAAADVVIELTAAIDALPAGARLGAYIDEDGARACFDVPTGRYAHGVLGDAIEWGALTLTLADGRSAEVALPENRVFEDVVPRLADLDGTGTPEIVVVESSANAGASLSIYAYDRGALVPFARTADIGRPNRWLAPVAFALVAVMALFGAWQLGAVAPAKARAP